MNPLFLKLYRYAAGLGTYPVLLNSHICPHIKASTGQDEISFIPVELDPTVSLGHIKKYRIPGAAPYAETLWIVDIRFHNDPVLMNLCWRRFVCCKELMHIFDSPDERADTRIKFATLLQELESPPLPKDQSEVYKSENRTKWMALAVLCPMPLRNYFVPLLQDGALSAYDVALALRVPEATIPTIMSEYFLAYLQMLETEVAKLAD